MNKNTLVTSAAVVAGLALGVQTVSADTVTVQAGDTVSEIAHNHGTSVSDIVNENFLSNPNLIFVGDKLQVNGNVSTANQTAKVSVQVPTVKTEQPAKGQTEPTVTGNKSVNYSSAENQGQGVQPQQNQKIQQSPQESQDTQGGVMSKTSGQLSQSEINQVANEMSSRTGESQETWRMIVNRESQGCINITNSRGSGAFGLFQNMHINSGTVGTQVNEAVKLYNKQGLQAWQATAW